MVGEKEEKKTLWYRFTSWVAASWLGRVVKWIADHTGISWALGKMKNLFSGKDAGNGASKEGTTTPESAIPKSPEGNGKVPEREMNGPNPEPVASKIPPVADDAGRGETQKSRAANEENVTVGYIEILRNKDSEEQLMLRVVGYLITTFSQNRYNNPKKTVEYLMYIQSYENVYQITYIKEYVCIDGKCYFPINSVKRQGVEGDAFCELDEMKNILGFNDSKKSIAITEISPEPFTPEVSSHKSAHAAGNANEAGSSSSQQSPEELKHNGCITAVNIADREVLRLVLVLNDESFIRDNNIQKEGIYSLHVQCGKNQYMITGSNSPKTKDNNYVSFDVDEVAFENKVYKELLKMKEVLDLNSDKRYVTIDNMFTFTPEVESHANRPLSKFISSTPNYKFQQLN